MCCRGALEFSPSTPESENSRLLMRSTLGRSMAPVPIKGGTPLGCTEPTLLMCDSESVCPTSCDVVPETACVVNVRLPDVSALAGVRLPRFLILFVKIDPTTSPTWIPELGPVPLLLRTTLPPATPSDVK